VREIGPRARWPAAPRRITVTGPGEASFTPSARPAEPASWWRIGLWPSRSRREARRRARRAAHAGCQGEGAEERVDAVLDNLLSQRPW